MERPPARYIERGHPGSAGRSMLSTGGARTIGSVSFEADRSHMRISDADRAATAERLRIALDEGRLDITEYD